MDKEEQLFKEYQKKRQQLEMQEDDIRTFQRKGQQIAEEAYLEIRNLLVDISETNEPLNEARMELSRLEEDFMLALSQEKKKLSARQDEVEENYRKEVYKLKTGD